MPPMPARRLGFTGRDISTTEFSWAWDRGPVGVMATAGVDIALKVTAEDDITAAAVLQPVAPMPVKGMAGPQFVPTPELRDLLLHVQAHRTPRQRTLLPMQQLHILRHMPQRLMPHLHTAAEEHMLVVLPMVGVPLMVVAAENTSSNSLPDHSAAGTPNGGAIKLRRNSYSRIKQCSK